VVQGEGDERQEAGGRRDAAEGTIALQGAAGGLLAQSTVVLVSGYHPRHSLLGVVWTAVTAAVMFTLATGKARTGRALGNAVLQTEGRVTMVDASLTVSGARVLPSGA
jgi:divalent metal cation (Fe/Co/Zn/Cd) transporter